MTDTNRRLAGTSGEPEAAPLERASVPRDTEQQGPAAAEPQMSTFGHQAQSAFTAQPVFTAQSVATAQSTWSPKGYGIASMVLGISAVIFAWTSFFAFILLMCAFVFGTISLRKNESPRVFAITGIILGSFAVSFVLIIIASIARFAGMATSMISFLS